MLLYGISAIGFVLSFIVYLAFYYRRVVPTNMVHIVQSKKHTIPYGAGKDHGNVYYEWPQFLPVIGVSVTKFPESIFQVSLENYDAYDANRLPFMVDVTAFFKVSDAGTVAQRVASFDELTSQLHQVIQGSVRRILGTNHLQEILESRKTLGDQFTKEVENEIKEWGVFPVKTIEFMDIRDSKESNVISNIMLKEKSKIEMESRITVAQNKQEAELKEVEAQQAVLVRKQEAEEMVGKRTAEKDQQIGISNQLANQAIKEQEKITAEKQMEVVKVNTVKQAEISKEQQIIQAQQSQEVMVIESEAKKKSDILKSEGLLQAAKNEATGIEAKGIAEGAAETAKLMAPVNSQITLAKEIGENQSYQQYLITIKQVEVGGDVGKELAKALQAADVKVISNAGDPQTGVAKVGDLFTTAGGTNLTGMLAALAQTAEGKALLDKFTKTKE
jgi:flotillin